MKKIVATITTLLCSNAYCEYTPLAYSDIFRYKVCSASWIAELTECDHNIRDHQVYFNDDRVANKYIPWHLKSEKIFIITPSTDAETVLDILQESPLEYRIHTTKNNFSGVFYNTNSYNNLGGDTYVKCDNAEKKCIIANNIISYNVSAEDITLNINKDFSNYDKPVDMQYSAFEFAYWALKTMK